MPECLKTGHSLAAKVFTGIAIALLILSTAFTSADAAPGDISKPEKLTLISGQSVIFESPKRIIRVSEPDPEIITVIVVSPHQVYLTGKSAGITNLILWHDKTNRTIRDLEVVYDVSRLKQQLHELLPNEENIRVIPTSDSITLAGRISSTTDLSQAIALTEAFMPKGGKNGKGKVVNLLEVGGIHQVMLEVRVAEMKRSLANRLGFNLGGATGDTAFGVTTLGGLTQVVKPSDAHLLVGLVGLLVSPAVNALFRFSTGSVSWTAFIDALNQDGLAKVLAEPTLITLSGQTATFLAGGEYPIPVPQGLGTVAIEFKPFGVSLSFTPTVLSRKKISIQVAPEVSELDFSVAQRLEGFIIPGLTTRRTSTVVELGDGQSFAIAGLLQETIKEQISKVPFLGDIPILGALFRSSEFQKNETELIIIATPRIVKPLDTASQPLPGDHFVEPSYREFLLEGLLEGRARDNLAPIQGEMDGDFGHSMPGS
jgi:pilus assembly protein CpaC